MATHNENIKIAIQEAERELSGLVEKLKEYEETRLRITNIETFIKAGKVMLGVTDQSTEDNPSYVSSELFPPKGVEGDLSEKSHFEGIVEILKDTNTPLSLRELAEEFYKRKWKLSEKNGRQVLRAAILRHSDKLNRIVRGITAYYELKT